MVAPCEPITVPTTLLGTAIRITVCRDVSTFCVLSSTSSATNHQQSHDSKHVACTWQQGGKFTFSNDSAGQGGCSGCQGPAPQWGSKGLVSKLLFWAQSTARGYIRAVVKGVIFIRDTKFDLLCCVLFLCCGCNIDNYLIKEQNKQK